MKTRVLYTNGLYYPQYKFLFWWLTFQEWSYGGFDDIYFGTENKAIDFCKKEAEKELDRISKKVKRVVWTSE